MGSYKNSKFLLLLLAAILTISGAFTSGAIACPMVSFEDKIFHRFKFMIDLNCDGEIRFGATGDSIVAGTGAPAGSSYPDQLDRLFNSPNFKSLNLGRPGATAGDLRRSFVRNINKKNFRNRLYELEYILIQIGTNGYWQRHNVTAGQEAMRTLRLKKYLERTLLEQNGLRTIVSTATIPHTTRPFQEPYINELNDHYKRIRRQLQLHVRFDAIPTSKLGLPDNLHPDHAGYGAMAKKVKRALLGNVQRYAARQVTDTDLDGIYDDVEVQKFSTDPLLSDTDEDGLSDGEEILSYETNPLEIDTDSDGIEDREEILSGTDPLDPLDPEPAAPNSDPDPDFDGDSNSGL